MTPLFKADFSKTEEFLIFFLKILSSNFSRVPDDASRKSENGKSLENLKIENTRVVLEFLQRHKSFEIMQKMIGQKYAVIFS